MKQGQKFLPLFFYVFRSTNSKVVSTFAPPKSGKL